MAIAAAIILAASAATALAQTTERVSVATGGGQTTGGHSYIPAISADGRFVAFSSDATNLVSGDTNGFRDIFVHDRLTGTTERVSVSTGGTEADGVSETPAISADGRFVAFYSDATNLVSGDTSGVSEIFVHDRQTGTTERVSVAMGGAEANGGSLYAAISADGRFVAFYSDANNLVSSDTNGRGDIFVHDRQTGTTERVSITTGGIQADGYSFRPVISADGRFVAFDSDATDLVSGDTNGTTDVFVHDRQTGTTERVSVATGGTEANSTSDTPAISADGRFVAFRSFADNLVSGDTNADTDIFVHDRQTGTTERVSVATGGTEANSTSDTPAISADGRFVTFYSNATDLVGGDTNSAPDVFVHDRQAGTTERVSVATGGTEGNGNSGTAAISADGRFVTFASTATNLVSGDSNNATDIFVRDRGTSGAAPLAPLALNATDIGADAFTANFTGQDATAAGYRLDVATTSTFSSAGAAGGRPAGFVPGYQSKVILCDPNPCVPGAVSQAVSGVQPGTQAYYYRVQAWGRGGDSPFSDTVLANPPPSCTLTADPTDISSGGSSTLTWASTGATSGSIDNSVGTLTPVAGGSIAVSPTADTTYTATFSGAGGNGTCQASVGVTTTTAIGPVELLALSLLALGGLGLRTRRT